ncbi:MAG TPA: TlpA disulfide reductase family protein [Geminicoccaceae bacterium]|nr:TlpA disulfide reductase family protein [Geminicoccus sp.]HMU50200.1 TlpA disulfide reductase family protein [Geminicoccaceae bacterium]
MRRLLALFLLLASTPARAIELAPPSGEALPALRFIDMQGNEAALGTFKGKVVVLNLWATWCAPCREEMPSLRKLAAELDPRQAVVLALSVDRAAPERVQKFIDEIGGAGDMLVYRDPKAAAARALKVPGLPATILVDRNGDEAGRLLGIAAWDSPEAIEIVRKITEIAMK